MELDLLRSLARTRIDRLIGDAAIRRSLAGRARARVGLRVRIARVVRAMGYAALSLGDALAQTR